MRYLKQIQIRGCSAIVFAVIFLFLFKKTYSQADSAKLPFLKATSLGVNIGGLIPLNAQNNSDQQLNYFKTVAANSNFTKTNFNDYRKTNFNHGVNFLLGAFIDFNPLNTKTKQRNKNVVYRFELIYGHKHKLEQAYYRHDSIVTDTLFSPNTGIKFKDSTEYSQNYYYRFTGRNIGIGTSIIKYFREGKNFRPYLGFGACMALSFNNEMTIAYSNIGDAYATNRHTGYKYANNYALSETYNLNNNITGIVYIPFGISTYRKIKPTKISFFIDARIGCKFEKYPYPNYTIVPFISTLAGVKIFVNRK